MVACQTEKGDFTIFKILNGRTVREGNEIIWGNNMYLGLTSIMDNTLNEKFDVYMLTHCVHKDNVDDQLLT